MTEARSRPRRRMRPWPYLLVALTFALCAPGSAFAMLEPPPGGGNVCTKVTFIGARGSGESFSGSHGMGRAVNHMAAVMRRTFRADGVSMSRLADPYPADSVSELQPSKGDLALLAVSPALAIYEYKKNHLDPYFQSITTGVDDVISDERSMLASCPHTKFVLAGYSQGAMVMHQAELQLVAGRRGRLIRHIAGTLLLGDGDRAPNTLAHRFGTSAARGEGIRTYLHANSGADVPFPSTTANICTAGDLVCDFNLGRLRNAGHAAAIHSGYAHGHHYRPSLAHAAVWLADLIVS